MTDKRETAPVRAVAFGLLAFVSGYLCWTCNEASRINMTVGRGVTRATVAINRLDDGLQFDLAVLTLGLVALAFLAGCASAIWDFFAPQGEGV